MSNGTAGANADPLRVLVADEHPFFRDGLRSLLTSSPGTELVGEASTGEEAVSLAGRSPTGRGTDVHTDAGDERHRGDSQDRAGQPARPRAEWIHLPAELREAVTSRKAQEGAVPNPVQATRVWRLT
jgi:hypothetical protein